MGNPADVLVQVQGQIEEARRAAHGMNVQRAVERRAVRTVLEQYQELLHTAPADSGFRALVQRCADTLAVAFGEPTP